MATEKNVGIVIKTIDYSDFDKIITVLTNEEILTFISLGVRKLKSKNRIALQLGNLIEFELFRARLTNKMSKLKKAVIIHQAPINVSDSASVLLEILKYVQKMQKHSEKLFNAFVEANKYFGEEYNHWAKTYVVFRMLDSIGLWPNNHQCVECKRKDMIVDYDLYKGGFICNLHSNKKLPLEELEAWKKLDKSMRDFISVNPSIIKKQYEKIIDFIEANVY